MRAPWRDCPPVLSSSTPRAAASSTRPPWRGACASGALGGAALDVFADEPLTAEAGALFAGCPNLLLTPHIAGVTEESNERVSLLTARNLVAG